MTVESYSEVFNNNNSKLEFKSLKNIVKIKQEFNAVCKKFTLFTLVKTIFSCSKKTLNFVNRHTKAMQIASNSPKTALKSFKKSAIDTNIY